MSFPILFSFSTTLKYDWQFFCWCISRESILHCVNYWCVVWCSQSDKIGWNRILLFIFGSREPYDASSPVGISGSRTRRNKLETKCFASEILWLLVSGPSHEFWETSVLAVILFDCLCLSSKLEADWDVIRCNHSTVPQHKPGNLAPTLKSADQLIYSQTMGLVWEKTISINWDQKV